MRARDEAPMRITGIDWLLAPTRSFQQSLAFFRDVMGMTVTDKGVPVTDTQFSRYAQVKMPNGVVLEIVDRRRRSPTFTTLPSSQSPSMTFSRPGASWKAGRSSS